MKKLNPAIPIGGFGMDGLMKQKKRERSLMQMESILLSLVLGKQVIVLVSIKPYQAEFIVQIKQEEYS